MDANPYESSQTTTTTPTRWALPVVITFIVGLFVAFLSGYMVCFVTVGYEYERRYVEHADQTAKDLQKMARDQADKSP